MICRGEGRETISDPVRNGYAGMKRKLKKPMEIFTGRRTALNEGGFGVTRRGVLARITSIPKRLAQGVVGIFRCNSGIVGGIASEFHPFGRAFRPA